MQKLMKTVADIFLPNDPVLVEKTLARIDEQDRWNDVFSTKLIELLDTNDVLKSAVKATNSQLENSTELLARAVRIAKDTETLLWTAKDLQLSAEKQLSIATHKDENAELKLAQATNTYRSSARCLAVAFGIFTFLLLTAQALISTSGAIRDVVVFLAIIDICIVGFFAWRIRQYAKRA